LVALLSILELSVSLVDQMVACRDVVMAIIFDAFCCILTIKVVFDESLLEKFVLNRHFFFSGEKSHVAVSILDLKGPGVVSDVSDGESGFWICIEDSPDHVFALSRQKFGQSVFSTHNFLIEV
jgi:hypothetical protein